MTSTIKVDTIQDAATQHTLNLGSGNSSLPGSLDLSNGGVYLGGTGSANYLDDYEEGTHFMRSGLSTGMVLNSLYENMKYVKIGNQVFCSGYINHTTVSGLSAAFEISLPFAATTTAGNAHGAAGGFGIMHEYFNIGTGYIDLNWYIAGGASVAKLYESRDNNTWSQVSENDFSTNTSLYFNFNYTVA